MERYTNTITCARKKKINEDITKLRLIEKRDLIRRRKFVKKDKTYLLAPSSPSGISPPAVDAAVAS